MVRFNIWHAIIANETTEIMMNSIIAFLLSGAAIGYISGFIYAFIASTSSQDILEIFIRGIAINGPIGMIWGGIIGTLFVAVQAFTVPPTKQPAVSSRFRRSFYDSTESLMKKISAFAYRVLGPCFIGYVLGLIFPLIAYEESPQLGLVHFLLPVRLA